MASSVGVVIWLWNQYAPFGAGVLCGGGIFHASPLITDTADAMGQESLRPCFNPQVKIAAMIPMIVMMATWLFVILSATYFTYTWAGTHVVGG